MEGSCAGDGLELGDDDGLELGDEDGLELGDDGLELGDDDGLELGEDDGLELGDGGLDAGGVEVCGDWHPASDTINPTPRIFAMFAALIIAFSSIYVQITICLTRPELLLNFFLIPGCF